FLVKNEVNWLEQNFSLVYQTSFENDSFLELQKFCTELISKKPEKVFNSTDFNSISEKSLISLIQHDSIQLGKIHVWEHVLKWGIVRNPELSSDPANYSKDDFNSLKNTLKQCIPFIKFHNFTSKEFHDKVLPYKKVFPKELFKSLLNDFLNNDFKPIQKSEPQITTTSNNNNIDSKIITFKHAELISKWVDKLEVTDKMKNSYEFKLILRGSRDGFTIEKFHEICDNQHHTVTFIKVKGSDEILGGYNPISWKFIGNYSSTKDSFIFSIKDNDNYILSRVIDEKKAIVNLSLCGPSFGNGDLSTFGDNGTCKKKSYEKPIREIEKEFSIEEYEIFQITNIGVWYKNINFFSK